MLYHNSVFRDTTPNVKEVDMLHATNYGDLNVSQLKKAVDRSKSRDRNLSKNISLVLIIVSSS